ncbi:Uncharacterised protein [uncultured archaeon]|nr:Uncharacterised protein [uncultured archaeon]
MPYIKKEDRKKWEKIIAEVTEILKNVPKESVDGDLNYFFTSIILNNYEKKYFNYNRAIGMLECCKQELYRKVIGPYEEEKIKENGDVELINDSQKDKKQY